MKREVFVEKQMYTVGERVEKFCVACGEERGHVVASVTKRGQISRVSCPQCGTRSSFKSGAGATGHRASTKASTPYDQTRTYRAGQSLSHPTFGEGEVTAVVDPQKIDVLFNDRMRRLIHARHQG
jgi:transcription elongation factor Elf1